MAPSQDDHPTGEAAQASAPRAAAASPPREGSSRDNAARLLIAPSALMQLNLVEAKIVLFARLAATMQQELDRKL